MSNILDELQWRGLVAQTTDESALREALADGPITAYCGFDPTAPSLHFGNLVQLVVLRHLQRAGHRVICLVGGSTGLIGDPRPTSERVLKTKEQTAEWVATGSSARSSRSSTVEGDNPAVFVNNLDWTAPMSALDFLRDVGKHFRVNQMVKKEAIAARLNSEEGISYTEFSYQLLQGLDYLQLYRDYGCTLQTGGQRPVGQPHRRRPTSSTASRATSVHLLTTPLLTDASGDEVRQERGQRHLAVARDDQPVRLLPVLDQRRGRLGRHAAQGLHRPHAASRSPSSSSRWPRSRSCGRRRRRWPPT